MNIYILVLVLTQVFFTISDLVARYHMSRHGFSLSAFISIWFLGYFVIRTLAMFGQLYIFSNVELGKTMALFGAVSIILSNILGLLVLKEVLPPSAYLGVSMAVVAFIILAFKV